METSAQKKKRSSNWTEEEKALLRHLLLEKTDIIENKDTTTITNNLKKSAWQDVMYRFNRLNRQKRDLKELVTQWRNSKYKVKNGESECEQNNFMAGEGSPISLPPENLRISIQEIKSENLSDSNQFDSDSHHASIYIPEVVDQSQAETTKPMQDTHMKKKFKPRLKYNTAKYEKELFLIDKRSREREIERAEELHKKRLAILDLEYEYWKKKIRNIEPVYKEH